MSAFETVKNVQVGLSSLRAPGWRKTWSRRAAVLAFAGGGATSFAGCGSVAGPEYTGEGGLELRGEVVSLNESQKNMIPALAFLGLDGLHVVEGDVTGEYPRDFVFRLDEPPPEEALLTGRFDGKPLPAGSPERVGIGFLVLVPGDHEYTAAPILRIGSPLDVTETEPDSETGEFTRTEVTCSEETDQCQTSVYACKRIDCETVFDRQWATDQQGFEGGLNCEQGCLTYEQTCGGGNCTLNVDYCPPIEGEGSRVSTAGTMDECRLLSREGEIPYEVGLSTNFASNFLVLFASEPGESEGISLQAGYNLLRYVQDLDLDGRVASLVCELDAASEVQRTAGDIADDELQELIEARQAECPATGHWERVEDPAGQELQISLGGFSNPL